MTKSLMMVLNRELNIEEGEMLLVKKPKGWTSFDVVNKLRSIFHVKKIGHAGTLDPMATGLLIVCTGKMTKDIEQYAGLEKEYEARIMLGGITETYDAESPVIEYRSTEDVTEEMVHQAMAAYVGFQTQIPPMWSAAKVRGRRLYQYARKGIEIDRKPKEIFIRSITPKNMGIPEVGFTVVCSKGTYVRTLVHDMGMRIGCGAYLMALERTRIGEFQLTEAASLDELMSYCTEHGN